jgi:hypothetical protein
MGRRFGGSLGGQSVPPYKLVLERCVDPIAHVHRLGGKNLRCSAAAPVNTAVVRLVKAKEVDFPAL